jgi:putative transposase
LVEQTPSRQWTSVSRRGDVIQNQGKDFSDKLVCELVQRDDVIAIEDLKIKHRVKNRHLSKSILDVGWG